jgi:uncharacterized protein YhbP (UPF0306 family)
MCDESKSIEKIEAFIARHHVLTLASCVADGVSACSLFYVYDAKKKSFIVASSEETLHIKQVMVNPHVAGNILLETKAVGKIQGLQFRGKMSRTEDKEQKRLYFKHFPYAVALAPVLWSIEVDFFKYTDNRLGFGRKLIWQSSLV